MTFSDPIGTYSHPKITFTILKMTYSNPKGANSYPKVTYSYSYPKVTNIISVCYCSRQGFKF